MTIADALDLRQTLRTLKKRGALDQSVHLAYAADKTLSRLNDELEDYEDNRRRIISEGSETDENSRRLVNTQGEKVALEENEDYQIVAAYEPDSDTEVDLSALGPQTQNCLSDQQAVNEKLNELRGREAEVDLHQVEEDRFMQHADLEGIHQQIDLTVLDPWMR